MIGNDRHTESSRINGGIESRKIHKQHGPNYRAGEHFDADKAIELMYKTLEEIYGC
jgi:hypothetical protein